MGKVGEVLKFRDGGPSVDEARKAMFAAKEAPSGLSAKNAVAVPATPVVVVPAPLEVKPAVVSSVVADVIESEFEEEIAPVAAPITAPAVVVTPAVAPKVERVETDQFVGEIKQEGGKWVAELRYKISGGTERFFANTKSELMLKLLEGKGHATVRVNKAVRREKLGWSELDRQYQLPDGVSTEDFEKMDGKAQDALLWTIATQNVLDFREAHPEFYRDPDGFNSQKLSDFLGNNKLPITLRNLEYAFEELTEGNQLKVRESKPVETPVTSTLVSPASSSAPARTDSVPVVTEPPAAPAAVSAPVIPAVTVRKRGTTGLRPGDSSSPTEPGSSGDGGEPRKLSEAELRKLPMSELKRIADADRRAASAQR